MSLEIGEARQFNVEHEAKNDTMHKEAAETMMEKKKKKKKQRTRGRWCTQLRNTTLRVRVRVFSSTLFRKYRHNVAVNRSFIWKLASDL